METDWTYDSQASHSMRLVYHENTETGSRAAKPEVVLFRYIF